MLFPINFSIALVDRCKLGDRAAQYQLYKLVSPAMFALCIKHAPTISHAEGMLEKGFIVIYNNIGQYDHTTVLLDWCEQMVLKSIDEYLVILEICSTDKVGSKILM